MRTRYRKILVAAALSALASMALLASAAEATTPAPPYEDFAGCPSRAENPFVGECIKFEFTGGHIGIGNREIPVTNPIILRGADEQETGNFLFNSEGGIVPVQQTVPGGLIGLTGFQWLDEAVEKSAQLTLKATVELAGQPGPTTAPTRIVPIKVHLENPFLGSSCYVGSTASPITLNLTTGTTSPPPPNTPITGKKTNPLEEEAGRPEVLVGTEGIYVDNAYSVPGATGCQLNIGSLHIPLDSIINSAYGLPSAAGHNTTVLNFNRAFVLPEVVYP